MWVCKIGSLSLSCPRWPFAISDVYSLRCFRGHGSSATFMEPMACTPAASPAPHLRGAHVQPGSLLAGGHPGDRGTQEGADLRRCAREKTPAETGPAP